METISQQNATGPFRRLIDRLSSWKTIRRSLIVVVGMATVIALFYTIENWRGKRAWEQCKRGLEARGITLDWSAYIPAPVPDAQNFFSAPGIDHTNWIGRGKHELGERLERIWTENSNRTVLAELVVTANNQADAGAILRMDDPAARSQVQQVIRSALGPALASSRNIPLLARAAGTIKPARVMLLSDHIPASTEIQALFPSTISGSRLTIEPKEKETFVLVMGATLGAGDFLGSSDQFQTELDVSREALKRPYARLPGDYSKPQSVPIPNFLMLRAVAQLLADRARSHLLLGDSDGALDDLRLLFDLCRVTEGKPDGKPMTLVAAMINVAVRGLYANTIADGFRLQAWKEPQLMELQKQLDEIHLAPLVAEAFRGERAFAIYVYENLSRREIAELFGKGDPRKTGWDSQSLYVRLAPRGWFYQNMVAHSEMLDPIIDAYDSEKGLFDPSKTRTAWQTASGLKPSPNNFLNVSMLPNFVRAWQVTAHNQTLANQAQIACALERYRAAHGSYPESLDSLVPHFLERTPHDVIGGNPLLYRRISTEEYLLYSVGWNEKDDGGKATSERIGHADDLENGDWVWQMPPPDDSQKATKQTKE